jgi:hypothetical protein
MDVAGLGRVHVTGDAREGTGLPAPIRVSADSDVTVVNRLTFDADDPDGTVQDLAAVTGWNGSQSRAAVAAIAQANITLVDVLIKACADSPDIRAAAVLGEAARVQRSVVEVFA